MMADSINTSNSTTNTTAAPATQREHHHLKCPRCDSSNTKFCYYNNYSLSQPRHFCKACKRYWTRGGTLRNVPVGGGCRKNKRTKKATASSSSRHDPSPQVSTARNDLNLLFYPLSSGMGTVNFPGYIQDLQQPQYHQSGFNAELAQVQKPVASAHAALLSDYPLFGSSLSAASLVVSSLNQPKKLDDYQFLLPYNELQVSGDLEMMIKNVKVEGDANAIGGNPIDWQMPCTNENSFNFGPGDSSLLYWNPAIGGLGHQSDIAHNY